MFTPENMHFKRLSCWADMSTNYTGVSLWWYVFRLYMFSYRAGGLWRILTTWANPKPFHIFVHLASDHGVNFWKCISFNLMFVSYFMHFHSMSSWADFQTLGTLKTRRGDVPCLYMGFNCGFCWVWIITGKAAPTPTWVFTHLRVNSRLYGINITRYVHWRNEIVVHVYLLLKPNIHFQDLILVVAVVTIFVNVQRVPGRTMFLANWTNKAFCLQMLCFNMHAHNRGTVRCEVTLCTAPLTIS